MKREVFCPACYLFVPMDERCLDRSPTHSYNGVPVHTCPRMAPDQMVGLKERKDYSQAVIDRRVLPKENIFVSLIKKLFQYVKAG